jgi:hypothetical protein
MGTLALGLIDVLCFTPDRFSISFGFSDVLQLGLQPLSLLFAAVYYFLNKDESNHFIRRHLLPPPSPQE